jgi:hypothetical protein
LITENATFTIPRGRTLIIEPGARVKFGEGARMVIQGKLIACGKVNDPILFTADATSGAPGFWAGLEFRDADPETVVGNAKFEFAGRDGHAPIWVEEMDIHLENVSFENNNWYALSLDANSLPVLRLPFEVENGPVGWEVRGGTMNRSLTWSGEQPYVINGLLEIGENASLKVQPGTWVKFILNSGLRVYGDMSASGDSGKPIRFTSANDETEEDGPEAAAGDWIGLQFVGRKGNSVLENVEVRFAGGESKQRGCLWLSDAAPTMENVTVRDCAAFSLSTDIASEPVIDGLEFSEEKLTKRWEIRESKLEGVTRRVFTPIYEHGSNDPIFPVITGWIGVEEEATLVVDPGTVLLFAGGKNAGFWSNGSLEMIGTTRDPIILTSLNDSSYNSAGGANAGDWSGLHLNNSKPEEVNLSHVIIRYAGAVEDTCLLLKSASPTIDNLTVSDCAAYPISSDAISRPTLVDLDLSSNQLANQWNIRESTLKEASNWEWGSIQDKEGMPIIRTISGVVTVDPEASLTIDAGVILKFTGGKGLVVRGGLSAQGSVDQPILMTSWRDPEGGGNESGPQPGDWGGLVLEGSQSVKSLSNVIIRYAGIPGNGVGCINMKETNPSMVNVSVQFCSYYPVTTDMVSDPIFDGLVLDENRPANELAIRESTLQKGLERTWAALFQADGREIYRTPLGWLSIDSGAQLNLNPGVVLKFQNGTGILSKSGTLVARGESDRPVVLTSWRDPRYTSEAGVQSGDWVGLALEMVQGDTSLENVEISYAGGNRNPRGAIALAESSPQLNGVTINNSAWYPVSMDVKSNPQVRMISINNNSPSNAIEVRGSTLDTVGEQVWSAWLDVNNQPLVRVVMNPLTINENATLRIERGTIVKFETSAGLSINGGLLSEGVVFTSLYDDQYGGDTDGGTGGEPNWQGVQIYGRKPTRITNSTVRFAQIGLFLQNAAPVLDGVSIENSWVAAISADLSSEPQITELTMLNNALNGLLLSGESLPEGETRWDIIGSAVNQIVRVVDHMLTIENGSRLVVDPGVVLKFSQEGGLIVSGELVVEGMEDELVYFTSIHDDISGDTDNLVQSPNRGSWLGITVNPNNTNARLSLFNTTIRYATNGLYVSNLPAWNYENLTITDSQLYGLACDIATFFDPEDEQIILINNGAETLECPTPDQEGG